MVPVIVFVGQKAISAYVGWKIAGDVTNLLERRKAKKQGV